MGGHHQEPEKQHLNKTMVMMPGFGAAAALFYRNFEGERVRLTLHGKSNTSHIRLDQQLHLLLTMGLLLRLLL